MDGNTWIFLQVVSSTPAVISMPSQWMYVCHYLLSHFPPYYQKPYSYLQVLSLPYARQVSLNNPWSHKHLNGAPWMPWTTLLPVDVSSYPVPPSMWRGAGALHGFSLRGCLPSPAGILLWVAVCDHLLSPHRSLATWGSSTVKWSLWMALCTVTHTQAMC